MGTLHPSVSSALRVPCNYSCCDIRILGVRLRECFRKRDVTAGRCVYDQIIKVCLESDAFLGTLLIRLFSSCGFLSDANQIFKEILRPTVDAWRAIILANSKHGKKEHAIKLYHMMCDSHLLPDNHVHVAALKACANLHAFQCGQLIHYRIVEQHLLLDAFVTSSLMDLYAQCGALEDSCSLFRGSHVPDKVIYGTMINAYTQHGHYQDAIRVYLKMLQTEIELDQVTFLCMLKASSSMYAFEQVKLLHVHTADCNFELDGSVGNALVAAYAKCGSIKDAHKIFCGLENYDVVTWGAMIEGFVQNANFEHAFHLFQVMLHEQIDPDRVVFVSMLKACSEGCLFHDGKIIHCFVIANRFESDIRIGSSMIDMYMKSGCLDDAYKVFVTQPYQNVVAWNAMITGYIHHGCLWKAFLLFRQFVEKGLRPNQVTFICALKLCSTMTDLQRGMLTHAYIFENGLCIGNLLNNTLINMYAKCGSFEDAHKMLERSIQLDTVTWGVIISGFVQHERFEKALQCFTKMLEVGLHADEAVFISVLKSSCGIGDLSLGKLIHFNIIVNNCELHSSVGNTLLDMYGKCGSFEDMQAVFVTFKERTVVTFNAMIAACLQYNRSQDCLQLFSELEKANVLPTEVTFVCILSVCADIFALEYGRIIHGHIVEADLHCDIYIRNALVDMYGKCGVFEDASRLFKRCQLRDVVSWNTIIATCARQSLYTEAIDYFDQMSKSSLNPDRVTFLSLLSSFSHAGQVDEGHHLLEQMENQYGLSPMLYHYSCMLDLYSRAGCLNEAVDFLVSTPSKANLEGRTSILSHCKENGNFTLGKQCFDEIFEVDYG